MNYETVPVTLNMPNVKSTNFEMTELGGGGGGRIFPPHVCVIQKNPMWNRVKIRALAY